MAYIGYPLTITWSTVDLLDPDGNALPCKIELSRNGGAAWETLVASTPNTGSYVWTVAGDVSANCVVRISDVGDASINDTGETFAIAAASASGGGDGFVRVGVGVGVCF